MFITVKRSGYDSHDQQVTSGLFLILLQRDAWRDSAGTFGKRDLPNGAESIRAMVRQVSMRQLGHFMMGTARVKGQSLTMSGSYGSDGLPKTVQDTIWEQAIPLPAELYAAWNTGGGWNGAGSEAEAMRQWALENLAALRGAK